MKLNYISLIANTVLINLKKVNNNKYCEEFFAIMLKYLIQKYLENVLITTYTI